MAEGTIKCDGCKKSFRLHTEASPHTGFGLIVFPEGWTRVSVIQCNGGPREAPEYCGTCAPPILAKVREALHG